MKKQLTILAALASCFLVTSASAQEVKIVANSAVSASDITSDLASKIFLKQTSKFADGSAAVPVYQAKTAPARIAFDKAVLGKTVAAVETFWQGQIFSGKDTPPASKPSDDDVIAFVKSTPGGIGYVSSAAATAGVKVLVLK
ncbi:MAG: phosphate ABC transporter substrate-binding protein [Gemmatimonadaceae bacterium]